MITTRKWPAIRLQHNAHLRSWSSHREFTYAVLAQGRGDPCAKTTPENELITDEVILNSFAISDAVHVQGRLFKEENNDAEYSEKASASKPNKALAL